MWYYIIMQYKLIRESRKTLVLKILDNGDILVKAPKKCSLNFINQFLIERENWITKHRENIIKKNIEYSQFFNLEKAIIFGEEFEILDYGNHYEIGEFYIKHTKSSNKQKVLKSFYNKLANEYVLSRCSQIASRLNYVYKDTTITSARKKWGSCNNLKQIKFNFRLVMLPKNLIDYVICHELCHLKELNHSEKFWSLLKTLGYNKTQIKKSFEPYNFVLKIL